jgi:hypothetical protein
VANEHYKALSDMRTLVRDQLDESSASFWTDAQINRYVNRAKDRVWNRLKAANEYYCTVTRTSNDGSLTIQGESYNASSFRIVAGTTDYTLPPDFEQLSSIESISSGLESVFFTQLDMNDPEFRALRTLTDNQSPWDEVIFDIIGEPAQLRLAVKPDVTMDIRLTYVQTLADLSADGDRLTLPNPLFQSVADYATMFALRQDRSPDAGTYEASGDKILAEFFGANMRQSQDPQVVRPYLEAW